MKIAYNNTIFSIEKTGGISRYFTCLINELIKKEIDIEIISGLHKNKFLNTLSKKYHSGFYFFGYPSLKIIEKYNNDKFNNYINKKSIDIIHDTYYTPDIDKPKKTKKIITVHDLIHEKFNNYYRNSEYEIGKKKKAFIDCDHFICVSNSTKNDLIEFYNIEPSKIDVVYHGGNHLISKYNETDSKIEKRYILFVGKRERYKNFNFFLKAYSKSEKINKNFKLVCFGGGPFNKIEKKLIEELKIANNISHMSGNDNLLTSFYSYAKAIIVPSLYEGFGLNVIEAMSLKCPVICSDIAVFREICEENAVYFDPNDDDNLISVLEDSLFNDPYLKKLCTNAYQKAKRLTWKTNSIQTTNIYKTLI